jgi:hypothetical protein
VRRIFFGRHHARDGGVDYESVGLPHMTGLAEELTGGPAREPSSNERSQG